MPVAHPSGERFEHATEGNQRVALGDHDTYERDQGEGDHPSGDRFEHETAGNQRVAKGDHDTYERDQGTPDTP